MQKFGIDVSHWQGNFNFTQAKAEGVEYVIIKAGGGDDGLYRDSKFEAYYQQAKSLGLGVGAYFFGQAMSISQAEKEADKFISLLKGKQFDYPVYYDVEAKMLQLGKKALTDVVIAFCDRVEKAGFYVGIYSGALTFNNNMDDTRLSKYAHWAAYWGKNKPKLNNSVMGMWQFGGETNYIRTNKVAGQVCDQDYCYVDYPYDIKRLGLNGYPKNPNMYDGVDYSTVYNLDFYKSHYPDLKKAYGNDSSRYLEHFVKFGMSEGRQAKEEFNVWVYQYLYKDLREAYGDKLPRYYRHFIDFGSKEKRHAEISYFRHVYDARYYNTKYPDLDVYGGDENLLIKHFLHFGMPEGRRASEGFIVQVYRDNYKDLREAFGDDLPLYYMHYIKFGYDEHREAVHRIR